MFDYRDQIVDMLNQGFPHEEIFWTLKKDHYWKNWNAEVRQELADLIAQTDELDVYAKGVVPQRKCI